MPADLKWSGSGEVPAVGTRVHIYMNSIGPVEVKAYFHGEGWFWVLCQADRMPEHLRKHGVTPGGVRQISRLGVGPIACKCGALSGYFAGTTRQPVTNRRAISVHPVQKRLLSGCHLSGLATPSFQRWLVQRPAKRERERPWQLPAEALVHGR